jgi:hypothetical protein
VIWRYRPAGDDCVPVSSTFRVRVSMFAMDVRAVLLLYFRVVNPTVCLKSRIRTLYDRDAPDHHSVQILVFGSVSPVHIDLDAGSRRFGKDMFLPK